MKLSELLCCENSLVCKRAVEFDRDLMYDEGKHISMEKQASQSVEI